MCSCRDQLDIHTIHVSHYTASSNQIIVLGFNYGSYSNMTILPPLSAMSQALLKPPSTTQPSINTVNIPAYTMNICNVSAHRTAFMPPWNNNKMGPVRLQTMWHFDMNRFRQPSLYRLFLSLKLKMAFSQ